MIEVTAPVEEQRASIGTIESHDGVHVILTQLEIEDLEILLDPRRGDALWNHH